MRLRSARRTAHRNLSRCADTPLPARRRRAPAPNRRHPARDAMRALLRRSPARALSARALSISSHRNDRFHLQRSSRRQIARDQHRRKRDNQHAAEGDRIGFGDAEEHSFHEPHETGRGSESDHRAGGGEFRALPHDQPQHVGGRGAEREADANFLRAFRDEIRDQPVDPERREQQRDRAEDANQRQAESPAGQRAIEGVVERARLHRERRVEAPHQLARAGATDAATSPRVCSTRL